MQEKENPIKNKNWLKGNLEIHNWIPDFSLRDTTPVYVLWYIPTKGVANEKLSMDVRIVLAEFVSFEGARAVKKYLENI